MSSAAHLVGHPCIFIEGWKCHDCDCNDIWLHCGIEWETVVFCDKTWWLPDLNGSSSFDQVTSGSPSDGHTVLPWRECFIWLLISKWKVGFIFTTWFDHVAYTSKCHQYDLMPCESCWWENNLNVNACAACHAMVMQALCKELNICFVLACSVN